MSNTVSTSAAIPLEYANLFECWVQSTLGEGATIADGVRALIADTVGMPRLPLSATKEAEKLAVREQRCEEIAQLRSEGLSWVEAARSIGLSTGRVRQIHANYERSIKRATMPASAK
jgi:hypothetical protein